MPHLVCVYRCRPSHRLNTVVSTGCFAHPLYQSRLIIRRFRHYSAKPAPAVSPTLPLQKIPHVTILRPVTGLEPQLYECLATTFRQTYPREKLSIYFCIANHKDAAYPLLQRLVEDHPDFDVRIFVEEEDPNLSGHGGTASNLGPNPKIRNMSRGYREARSDIVWIIDCNVWIGKGVAGRMIDKLCGLGPNGTRTKPFKFVHQLPLVVDNVGVSASEESHGLLGSEHDESDEVTSTSTSASTLARSPGEETTLSTMLRKGGGRLEEMFMASTHAKFYTAINTVSVAPCIVGKSNMFRRSHLDYLTSTSADYAPGIDFFSHNICEDHLIGDRLWRNAVPGEAAGEVWGKHGLVLGDLAIQPMASMSVREYVARRVRWLRVRKWTVTLATMIEPGVESILCSAYGAFAFTTVPWFHDTLSVPQTWLAFLGVWSAGICAWATVDRIVYQKLQSGASVELDAQTPHFARPPPNGSRRPFLEWLAAWLGRELLALPVWSWAVLGGGTVVWRGKRFWVGMDMRVHEIKSQEKERTTPEAENGLLSKARRD